VTRIIVFRFDRNPLVCRSRVTLLRALNPGVELHGVLGGTRGLRRTVFRLAGKPFLGLDTLYKSPRSGLWNWKNGDLVLAAWYRDVGRYLDFDVLHFVEWDLLMLGPIEQIYSNVPIDAVALTAFTPLSEIERDWEWLSGSTNREAWEELRAYVRAGWGYEEAPYACMGMGPCFPRRFLAEYASIDPPDLCHDELRLPLFAQALGFDVVDTGFRPHWHDPEEDRFFNGVAREISRETVDAELRNEGGRRVFHPARFVYQPPRTRSER
jgi:hypothetical protein